MILKMENDDCATRSLSDFSIDHILNRAGSETQKESKAEENIEGANISSAFSWLQCTRFCPPRIPRMTKKDAPQKRQLGRYPRIPFTNQQTAILEEKFRDSPYLSSEEATNLAKQLHLTDVKVKIWFQNRRARKRREEMGLVRKDMRKYPSTSGDSTGTGSTGVKEDLTRSTDAASTSGTFGRSPPQVQIPMPFIYVSPQNILDFSHR